MKPDRPVNDPADLVDRARTGDARAVARLITLVENDSPLLREIARLLVPHVGRAQVVAVTGPPGAGKSTSTAMLVSALRQHELRVGVLAVDPSSPFSGGALLGDRIRMQEHATDPGVFIRSMATRGHLGGLAAAAPQALRVLDAAGCDVIVIETVGVGQSEVEVMQQADTTIVLLAPGMGDGVQAAKAGILEVADLYVVNKADRDGADQVVRDLRYMQSLRADADRDDAWQPPILKTVAVRGEGVDDVVSALRTHREWLQRTGELARRRTRRAATEVEALALVSIRRSFGDLARSSRLADLARQVAEHSIDPFAASDCLVSELRV